MGNKKIVVQKKELQTVSDLGQLRIFDKSFLENKGYVEVELVPVEAPQKDPVTVDSFEITPGYTSVPVPVFENEGFPIEIELSSHFSMENAGWKRLYNSIKELNLSVPVKLRLDTDGMYSAISVLKINDTLFSVLGGENLAVSDIMKGYHLLTKEEIQEMIVAKLKNFLDWILTKTDVMGSTHWETGKRIFHTYSCPDRSIIQIIASEKKG